MKLRADHITPGQIVEKPFDWGTFKLTLTAKITGRHITGRGKQIVFVAELIEPKGIRGKTFNFRCHPHTAIVVRQ